MYKQTNKTGGIMSIHSKYFCLGCEKVNACSCGTTTYIFQFSHKLRPPTKGSKVKWRKFLKDCPQFCNCVGPGLQEEFGNFLKSKGLNNDTRTNKTN